MILIGYDLNALY